MSEDVPPPPPLLPKDGGQKDPPTDDEEGVDFERQAAADERPSDPRLRKRKLEELQESDGEIEDGKNQYLFSSTSTGYSCFLCSFIKTIEGFSKRNSWIAYML